MSLGISLLAAMLVPLQFAVPHDKPTSIVHRTLSRLHLKLRFSHVDLRG